MESLRNQYALHAIRERRAELAGEVKSLESRLRNLRESLVHLDATLRLFDPDADPSKIAAKRPAGQARDVGDKGVDRQ